MFDAIPAAGSKLASGSPSASGSAARALPAASAGEQPRREVKLFVLDTNVILHDSRSIFNFAEHDIAIPITVLEELDKFKRGNEDINFQAREFLRQIDALTGDLISAQGAALGPHLGHIRVVLGGELDSRLKAGVLLMGGLGSGTPAPEADSFNFAPRVRVPILMLNGDQDFIFPLQTSQQPLFQALGTPAPDKRHVLYPGGHEIFATQRSQVIQEVVNWLDRYLGRVQ